MPKKIIILGLDGTTWTKLDEYIETGFMPKFSSILKNWTKGINGEIQLLDSIQTLIKGNRNILGSIMPPNDPCIDIGVPETYFTA